MINDLRSMIKIAIQYVRQSLRGFFGLPNPKWHRTPSIASKAPSKANLPPNGPH